MTAMIKEAVLRCPVCLAYRPSQPPEPLSPHEIPSRPWEKVAMDLFDLRGETYLLIVDYFTNFVEVEPLSRFTAAHVISALTSQFARYGLPETLISDNGPPFSSDEFRLFTKELDIQHKTSSPRYPQSNGKAENSVKTVKNLMRKAMEDGKNPLWALLMWRNTPSEGMSVSPAQKLFGRACRTFLPALRSTLLPCHPSDVPEALARQKARQASYYDRKARPLPPLIPGQSIRMRLPGQITWSPGICLRDAGPRSYWVRVDGVTYRRNRRQLLSTSDPPPPPPLVVEEPPVYPPDRPVSEPPSYMPRGTDSPMSSPPSARRSSLGSDSPAPVPPAPALDPGDYRSSLRRSGRVSRPPAYLADYVPR
ncbi:uncharacterized protein K02A2.6-like [Amphibalanus amphitrite]|uniref:uncharacterized protein K02A2.6-like n=1 Tax=Amphibalanus amphitrite TaxID=1232801 RepID=UPI001C90E75E|nr:uncharacterized protein K02A2.6-like [Amphibalanus amphitrite]